LVTNTLWNITRATRQIQSCISATKILKKFEGREWTRDVQEEFGKAIADAGIKSDGITRKDSGGNRTWAVLPKTFGVWYKNENNCVVFTPAGNIVADGGKEAIKMMERQILTFQFPNRTADTAQQIMDPSFKIFPHRFLVKLMLEVKNHITVEEIQFFALNVRTDAELSAVAKKILDYREKANIDLPRHQKENDPEGAYQDYEKSINDLANTFKNHLEFLPGFSIRMANGVQEIFIEEDRVDEWKEKIQELDATHPLLPLYAGQSRKFFVEKYGVEPGRTKASMKTGKPKTKNQTREEAVRKSIEDMQNKPVKPDLNTIINKVEAETNFSKKTINDHISAHPEWLDKWTDKFGKKYLEVAGDGNRWEEFQEMTNGIFKKFGFNVERQQHLQFSPGQSGYLDGYITHRLKAGFIDSKSGKKFDCGNKEVGVMKDYITKAKALPVQLEFFGYVFGRKFSNTEGFNRIISESGLHGFRISAMNLLYLMKEFDIGKISKDEIWILFKSNNEIQNW
jgi:hypothetical protein